MNNETKETSGEDTARMSAAKHSKQAREDAQHLRLFAKGCREAIIAANALSSTAAKLDAIADRFEKESPCADDNIPGRSVLAEPVVPEKPNPQAKEDAESLRRLANSLRFVAYESEANTLEEIADRLYKDPSPISGENL